MKRRLCWLTMGLALVMALATYERVLAAGPPEDDPDPEDGRRVGLVSTTAGCMTVQAGTPDSATATVRLEWEGQIEEAFLVLSPAGSQGGHSIYVNGQRVGSSPVHPGGRFCQAGAAVHMSIPAKALLKGENVITLTNDANFHDGWTAANLRIEIHGVLSGPSVASLEGPLPVPSPTGVSAEAPVSGTVWLTSTYELAQIPPIEIAQAVWYQIPASYTGSVSVPLLIGIHGMKQSGQRMRDLLATEANDRGWLLAAPDMHGRFYINTGDYALAYIGAQHDVLDTIEYMVSEYEVDLSRIYVTGRSMGGQTTAMMVAKYPDVFAAAAPWKPLTDLAEWYNELGVMGSPYDFRLQIERETGGTSVTQPFEYQRRSPMQVPQNSRLMPIKMWHEEDDALVQVHHSQDLRDAINGWAPPTPVTLIEVPAGDNDCAPDGQGWDFEHCYDPPPADVLEFLSGFTLDMASPLSLTIRTDESKPYYWMNIVQTGGNHWSSVEAAYSLAERTVRATILDTQPLSLAFNLGSTFVVDPPGISRPGMGLPATTYLVLGGGNYTLESYTSGYLTTTLATTGQYTLTLSAVRAMLSADPGMVSGWQTTTTTIASIFEDHLGNPAPDGTVVQFSADEGTFPNASSAYAAVVAGGVATASLTLAPTTSGLVEVMATVGDVTGSMSINIIHPAIDVLVSPDQTTISNGQVVTYTYQLTNTGDVTLTAVRLVDDPGTPGDGSDDISVCSGITLTAGHVTSCERSATLTETITNTATVTAQDPLGHDVINSDSTTVIVGPSGARIYLPVVIRN